MFGLLDIIWLVAIAFAAVLKIRLLKSAMLRTRNAAFLNTSQDLTHGFWLALVMVLPMLAMWLLVDDRLMPIAANTLSLPIGCAVVGIGIGCIVVQKDSENVPIEKSSQTTVALPHVESTTGLASTFAIVAAIVAGLFLAVQSLAGPLTLGVGQSLLAISLVVLWITSPPSPRTSEFRKDNDAVAIGMKRLYILFLAVAQSLCVYWLSTSAMQSTVAAKVAGGLLAIEIVILLAIVGRLGSPAAIGSSALRLATFAVILGLGTLSMSRFIQSWLAYRGGDYGRELIKLEGGIVRGFEEVIYESALLIIAATLAATTPRNRSTRIAPVIGLLCIISGAAFIGWRLNGGWRMFDGKW